MLATWIFVSGGNSGVSVCFSFSLATKRIKATLRPNFSSSKSSLMSVFSVISATDDLMILAFKFAYFSYSLGWTPKYSLRHCLKTKILIFKFYFSRI
jgi:hypothetical protein